MLALAAWAWAPSLRVPFYLDDVINIVDRPAVHMTELGVESLHKALTETLRYVHVAEDHRRPLPPAVLAAQQRESDPDQRVVAMLGARLRVAPMWHQRNLAAATTGT